MSFEPGTIYRWDSFDEARNGEIKDFWFVLTCITGSELAGEIPVGHLIKITSQKHHYEPGGSRTGHSFIWLPMSRFTFLEKDSVFDFQERPYLKAITLLGHLIKNKTIEVMGCLHTIDPNIMPMVYRHMLTSGSMSNKAMLDIHQYLNKYGITGLPKPTANRKIQRFNRRR